MEKFFCGMIDNLPKGRPLEKPLHPRKKRELPAPAPLKPISEKLWSSMEVIAPTQQTYDDPLLDAPGFDSPELDAPELASFSVPSPAEYVEHGSSRSSTPHGSDPLLSELASVKYGQSVKSAPCTPHKRTRKPQIASFKSGGNGPSTSRKVTQGNGRTRKRSAPHADELHKPSSRQRLDFSSEEPRPSNDQETKEFLNYGSEEESDDDACEEILPPLVLPRVERMYYDEDIDDLSQVNANLRFEWPPHLALSSPPSSPLYDFTPANPNIEDRPTSPTFEPLPAEDITEAFEPRNKFDFRWRAFSPSQDDPKLRREKFSQTNCGPTVSLATPYKAFTAIWDQDIMGLIAKETNIYAQQVVAAMIQKGTLQPSSRISRWRNTNISELFTYFAIIHAMGIVVKSRVEEYWNSTKDIFSTPGFAIAMSYDRFFLLSKCLHFWNNENCKPELLSSSQAKIVKIAPVIDHLNKKFQELYVMSQNVALDESLTMWKGWLDINQFIKDKSASLGIKTYEICESKTGYLWRFEVHAGHETSQDEGPVSGKIPALVLRLVKDLENKGYSIWMDNYYNSPALARELKSRGFDCIGTLRTNRQFVPSELAKLDKKTMAVGEVYGCTSSDVDVMVWRDKNRVAFISTYHGLETAMCHNTLKPTVVLDYNICMGGVDRKDQMLAMYPIERKRSKIWYKKFFRRLLNVSTLNAYILLKPGHNLSHRKFRKVLVTELLAAHRPIRPTSGPTTKTTTLLHVPAQYDLIQQGKSDRLKRQCAVCKKRTITYCKACNVAMCVFTCYEPYHTTST